MSNQKRKVTMPAGIRNKMMAAVSMLLVSSIMMVSSTYAWFTLSTAPEVKNISTTVAGNGSLEIALMPESGLLKDIKSGFSSTANGGTVAVQEANKTWGNVITMTDKEGNDIYGLKNVTLNPASLNYKITGTSADSETGTSTTSYDYTKLENNSKPLALPVFGYDGRVEKLDAENTAILAYNETSKKFDGTGYGVRAIGEMAADGSEIDSAYAYAIDLAFRLNTATKSTEGTATAGKLLLQTKGIQRIYNGETPSSNAETLGNGSYMSFNAQGNSFDMTTLMQSIRVTFIKDYGLSTAGSTGGTGAAVEPVILGTARLDTDSQEKGATEIKVPLYMTSTASDGTVTLLKEENAGVILESMQKNAATQVTAVVWLDGNLIKNSSVAASKINNALMQSTLNLQFSTDAALVPAQNNALIEGNAQ